MRVFCLSVCLSSVKSKVQNNNTNANKKIKKIKKLKKKGTKIEIDKVLKYLIMNLNSDINTIPGKKAFLHLPDLATSGLAVPTVWPSLNCLKVAILAGLVLFGDFKISCVMGARDQESK